MADRYRDFSIPQLRRILDDRRIDMQNARTRTELINLLVEADKIPRTLHLGNVTATQRGFINEPIVPGAATGLIDPRRIEPVITIPQPGPLRQPAVVPVQPMMRQNLVPIQPRVDILGPDSPYRPPLTMANQNMGLSQQYLITLRSTAYRAGNYPSFDFAPYRTNTIKITWGAPITKEIIYSNDDLRVLIGNNQYTIDPVGYYMMLNDSNKLSTLLTEIGFTNLVADEDVCYNLLWYMHASMRVDPVSSSDKAVLSGMTDQQLLTILGPTYAGPRDKAALLFAAISGRSIYKPAIDNLPRYQKVKQYPAPNVWYIARLLYDIVNRGDRIVSPYGPYVHIAVQPPHIIEEIMSRVRPDNVETFMRHYGMISNIEQLRRNNVNLLHYFMAMISEYEPVLRRGSNVLPLNDLNIERHTEDEVEQMLAPYTVDELVNFYEVTDTWDARIQLIRQIRDNYRTELHWAIRNRYCNNDDMFNIIEGERRGDINKNNADDPTIGYGMRGNYACYQASELTGSFHEDDNGIFQFYNPDWSPIKMGVDRTFTIESMKQLQEVFQNLHNKPPTIIALEVKLQQGIAAAQNTDQLARKLRSEYQTMTPYQQQLVQLYIGWLFYYGMWLRFWKGPGEPWPLQWMEHGGDNRCVLQVRDAQTVIQQAVGYLIMQNAARQPGLQQWLEALPLVDYDFSTGEARVATKGATTIKQILDPISRGIFCLANGSDLILRDAYFLITSIFRRNNQTFDGFLRTILISLYDYEYEVVMSRLRNRNNERPQDLQVLLDREQVLAKQIPALPPLRIEEVTWTGHTDPQLGQRIRFDQ